MKNWFGIISDLMVNLSAGWLAVIFIEPQKSPIDLIVFLSIIAKLTCAIMSLIFTKYLREVSRL